jgi:ABC-type phosphate/phosphonate transport system substrate-binding protein
MEVLLALFLFLKTGEKFATQETAGPTVAMFTTHVAKQVGLEKLEPRVMNDPAKAVEFVAGKKPLAGIVTPGFYLTYAKALGMEPLLETYRQKVATEKYVLVVKKDAPAALDALEGKTIATSLAPEQRYVIGVILQDKLGEEIRLKPVTDMEGAALDLVEGAKDPAAAVLMEEGTWKVLSGDEELGSKLKVVFTSDDLPHDLVVVFRPNAGKLDVEKLKAALKMMNGDEAGQTILTSIRVEKFADVNQERLTKAQTLFHGK